MSLPNERRIEIRYPLPMDVAGSLLNAIGAMWPQSRIDTTVSHSLSVVLPEKQRAARRISKKNLRSAVVEDEVESEVTQFDGATLTVTTPDEIQEHLAQMAYVMLTGTEGATNYVEFSAHHPESSKTLVVSCAWSQGQTPAELRQAAEQRASELADECQRLKQRVEELERLL